MVCEDELGAGNSYFIYLILRWNLLLDEIDRIETDYGRDHCSSYWGIDFWIRRIPHCYGMCGPLHISVCALNRTYSLRSLRCLMGSYWWIYYGIIGGLGEFINIGPNYCCQLDIFPFRRIISCFFQCDDVLDWLHGRKKKGIPVPKTGWLARFLTEDVQSSGTTFIPCGMLYAAFALAVGCGTGLQVDSLCFICIPTFFMQLGIS